MYLRYTTVKKDGKVHRYWRLVRSVRVGRRVIQQTVAQLGELDARGRLQARTLARHLIGEPEQAGLFDDGQQHLTVPVRLKGVRVERSRRFGDVYLALALWRGTGLADLCEKLLPSGKEAVPWAKMVAVLVAARLCEPSSELHIAEDWYRRTALCDLLQLDGDLVNKDRLYRALDLLLEHKAELEAHLSRRSGELFAIDNEVLLYDVTSTYFEGEAQANPLAQRGHSRDHRPDCKQVCIALVVTFDGFPLGYEVFAGNTHDSKTVQTIVSTMEARHGVIGRVWIADRGMASAVNLAWLRQTARRYIIGAPKASLRQFAAELAEPSGWREIREGIAVRLARWPETGETAILCRSADRCRKEQAMHDKFSQRIAAALARLAGRIERSRKRLDAAKINRQIGRLLKQNQRSAARFHITLQAADCPAGLRLHVERSEAFDEWAPSPKAPTCCAPTSKTGATSNCGRPTFSSPRSRPPSASTRISCACGRSGISARIACSPTSWSASSPSCCGRRSRCGSSARAWATPRAPCSMSSPASNPTTSFCPRQRTVRSDCAASPSPTTRRLSCSIASASSCPSACAPTASCPSRSPPKHSPEPKM
jgi:hypothetical protein